MYKKFEIRNFRCFKELVLSDMERVNLIAGMNNVGKTALLEALFIHCGAYNPSLTIRLNAFRGIESFKIELGGWGETPWDTLFNGFDISNSVELVGENETTGRRTMILKVLKDPGELPEVSQFIQQGPSRSESALLSLEKLGFTKFVTH